MALIKCKECGHEVSDRASACPNCGCPIEKGNCCIECGQPIPDGVNECPNCGCPTQDNLTHGFESAKKSKNGLIWLISILALSVLLGGGYYLFDKANGAAREKVDKVNIDSLLADGHYTFKGNWESSRHSAQPCKVEFEKKGGILENCAYTNLKYDTRIPLNGTMQNDTLHFVGDISGKQLVINLKINSNGEMLVGEGIDYAHSEDKAKINLSKIGVANTIEQKHPYEERETVTDNGSNNISENPNKEGYSEYIGKFRINGPDEIRQIITLREDKSVLLEVHYDFSNSDYTYKGVWRPYRSHYGDMICLEFTSKASIHIGRGWNPQKTIYYIYDMKIAMNYNDIPAHDEDAYSAITRM